MYLVEQTKGLDFPFTKIVHRNISSLEKAIEMAKEYDAKYVYRILYYYNLNTPITQIAWRNENVK